MSTNDSFGQPLEIGDFTYVFMREYENLKPCIYTGRCKGRYFFLKFNDLRMDACREFSPFFRHSCEYVYKLEPTQYDKEKLDFFKKKYGEIKLGGWYEVNDDLMYRPIFDGKLASKFISL